MIDINLEDVPGAAIAGGAVASVGDLLLYGGDAIVAAIMALASMAELWVPFFGALKQIVAEFQIIPPVLIDNALLVLWSILAVAYAIRIVRKSDNVLSDNS